MRKCLNGLFVLTALCYSRQSLSQQYFYNDKYYDATWLLGISVNTGGMNVLTDLGGGKGNGQFFLKDLNIQNTKLCLGVQLNLIYDYTFGIKASYTHGKITAADSILRNKKGASESRWERNLHVRSPINEFTVQFDWYFLQSFGKEVRLSPFVSAGIGYFSFNPQAALNGNWIDLAPLHTEGQGFSEYPDQPIYSLRQFNFPLGIGLQYEVSALLLLRSEILHRFLQTDYLDDVSRNYIDPDLFSKYLPPDQAFLATQIADRRKELNPLYNARANQVRGNPSRNDAYFTINIGLTLILNRIRR